MQPPHFRILATALSIFLFASRPAAQQIGNGIATLDYAPDASLGIELVQVANADTGVSIGLARADAWELTFRRISDGALLSLRPSQIVGGSVSIVRNPAGDEVTATWTAPAQGEIPPLDVTLKANAFAGDDVVSFSLEVDPAPSATLSLYRLELLLGADPLNDPATEVLASPLFLGVLFFDPLVNPNVLATSMVNFTPTDPLGTPSHPGTLSMQWSAYYRDDPGGTPGPMLFWGTRDLDDNLKPYGLEICAPNPGNCAEAAMMFGVQHYPADNLQPADAPAAFPFSTVLTALRGDWYDAARYYRSWVLAQNAPWVAQGAMKDNPEFSQHVLDAEMIATVLPARCDTPPVQGPSGPGSSKVPVSASAESRPGKCDATFDYAQWGQWTNQMGSMAAELGVQSILLRAQLWDYNSNLNWLGDWFPIRPEYQAAALTLPAQFPFANYFGVDYYHPSAAGYGSSYVAGHLGVSVDAYTVKRETGETVTVSSPLVDRTVPCGVRPCEEQGTQNALCLGTSFPGDYARHVNGLVNASGTFVDAYHADPKLCYNPGHISAGDHPEGDGRYWTRGKRKVLEDLKMDMRTMPGGDPEYFLMTEGVSEAYLSVVEATWNRYSGFTTSKAGNVARAPLFQTVYNDYQMTGSNEVVSLEFLTSARRNRAVRQYFAAHVFQGGEPFAGAVLGAETLSQQLADPTFANVALTVELIEDSMAVLKQSSARDLIVFGERLREPTTDSPVVDLSLTQLSVEQPGSWIQPFVYAAVFGDPTTPRIGLLLVNWTDASDPLTAVGPGAPGDQVVTVDLDLSEYGFTPGATYDLQVITSSSTGPVGSYTYPGGTQQQTFPVPELSAVLSILGPESP